MSILDEIVAQKKREVAPLPARGITRAGAAPRRDFARALKTAGRGSVALIAEVKKASPSAGVICADFDPVRIAREYEAAGANCLSVLTDERFFQGSLDHLRAIRQAVKVPLLRKDFIIDERQIAESLENGADAILLIVRILSGAQLQRFRGLAEEAGLAALVEVHDEAELERAQLIGINNRNLDTFAVDLGVTERLAAKIKGSLIVAESGIHNRGDVERVRRAGANAILVGESLMRDAEGIAAKVRELIGASFMECGGKA